MADPANMENAAAALDSGGGMSLGEFFGFVWQTWIEGGWLMIPLAGLALLIYFEAMALILRLGKAQVKKTPRSIWSDWIDDPGKGHGHIGEVIRFVVADEPAKPARQCRVIRRQVFTENGPHLFQAGGRNFIGVALHFQGRVPPGQVGGQRGTDVAGKAVEHLGMRGRAKAD